MREEEKEGEEVQGKPTRREKKKIYRTRKKKKKKKKKKMMMMVVVEPAAQFCFFCLVVCGRRRWQAEEVGEIECNTMQSSANAMQWRSLLTR
jgi:hypothetical protein